MNARGGKSSSLRLAGASISPAAGATSVRAEPAPPAAALPSIVAAAGHWVSSAAIRKAVGAWAYSLSGSDQRPTDADTREAVAVASAFTELVQDPAARRWRDGREAEGSAASAAAEVGDRFRDRIVLDPRELGRRSGLSDRTVEAAIALLVAARVLAQHTDPAGITGCITPAVWAPAPAVATVRWDSVRSRLDAVGASVAPAMAVLRELATDVGAVDSTGAGPAVRTSVRELEHRTAYGRGTVAAALQALERGGLIALETRAGRMTRFTICEVAFGRGTDGGDALRPSATESVRARRDGPLRNPGRASGAAEPVGGPQSSVLEAPIASATDTATGRSAPTTGTAVPIGEFGGTPIYAPLGTPVTLECDADGRWSCRVGPFLRLGPLGPPDLKAGRPE